MAGPEPQSAVLGNSSPDRIRSADLLSPLLVTRLLLSPFIAHDALIGSIATPRLTACCRPALFRGAGLNFSHFLLPDNAIRNRRVPSVCRLRAKTGDRLEPKSAPQVLTPASLLSNAGEFSCDPSWLSRPSWSPHCSGRRRSRRHRRSRLRARRAKATSARAPPPIRRWNLRR